MDSNTSIYELREQLEKLLETVPDGERVSIPNQCNLDKLLFDTYVLDEKKGIVVKFPVWTGPFLSKLDLSNVNFEDVTWSINNDSHYSYEIEELIDMIKVSDRDSEDYEFEDNVSCDNHEIDVKDFSNTNAIIDFKKSFEYKVFNFVYIQGINFENVNLSNNVLSMTDVIIENSNLANTNINLNNLKSLEVEYSNLENVDLSRYFVELFDEEDFAVGSNIHRNTYDEFDSEYYADFYFGLDFDDDFMPCYRNTGLQIKYDEKMEEVYDSEYDSANITINGIKIHNAYDYLHNSGLFDGCVVNHKQVKSIYMRSDDIIKCVEEQIQRMRKREKED